MLFVRSVIQSRTDGSVALQHGRHHEQFRSHPFWRGTARGIREGPREPVESQYWPLIKLLGVK